MALSLYIFSRFSFCITVSNPYLANNTDFKGLTSGINFECNNIFDSVPYSNVCDSLGEDSDDLEDGDEYDEDYDFITDED